MRLLRAFFVALLTAVVGCVLAFFVGDYLTRLAHVPEMEGQRGMTIIFLCVPLGILAGLVIGIASAILVRREGFSGFLIAQGWSLRSSAASLVCCLAFRTCYRTKLHASMANNLSYSSNFARHRLLRFRISLMVTAFGQVCTSTIGNPNSHSSTGAASQKMPNRSQSRDVLPYSRIARADRSSHRSVTRRKRRNSSS